VKTSDVPARLGFKASSLAWPETALAFEKIPGRAKAVVDGLAPAWLGLGRDFCVRVMVNARPITPIVIEVYIEESPPSSFPM
jgi:hypothetical protein